MSALSDCRSTGLYFEVNLRDSPIAKGLSVSVRVKIVSTGHILVKIKNVKNNVYTFSHLLSNGVIAKIALNDLDRLFVVKKFKNNYISEKVRTSAQICGRHLSILTFAIDKIALCYLNLFLEVKY